MNPAGKYYPWKAYLNTLLSFNSEAKNTWLMQQGWYEDFIEKFQYPELDPSNLNFMQRRQLFLSEDGAEFTTDLVTLIGRLHIDIGKIRKRGFFLGSFPLSIYS